MTMKSRILCKVAQKMILIKTCRRRKERGTSKKGKELCWRDCKEKGV
jgi:hypothetical protein